MLTTGYAQLRARNARRLKQHVFPWAGPLDRDGIKRAEVKKVAADREGIMSLASSILDEQGCAYLSNLREHPCLLGKNC